MKKRNTFWIVRYFILLFLISTILAAPQTVLAKSNSLSEFVIDQADILTPEEENLIAENLSVVGTKHHIKIIVYTLNDSVGNIDNYITEFKDRQNYPKDCVILAINMLPSNRQIHVQGYGKAHRYIANQRAQSITDNMVSDCQNEQYYNAIRYFVTTVDYDMSHKIEVVLPTLGLILLGSMLFSGMIVFFIVYTSGGRNTTSVNTYLDFSSSKLLAKRDIYTHTTITRHKRESSSNNRSSGGGSSHSSGTSSF